jgi:acyl-CoA thioesterase
MSFDDLTPDARANAVGDFIRAHETAAIELGHEIVAIAPGRATVAMTVTKAMLNVAGVCHGGLIFALADSALGYAACSHGRQTASSQAGIHWLAPARLGDRLSAEAVEIARTGKTALYDVAVRNQAGARVAEFRGGVRIFAVPVGTPMR